MIGQTLAFWKRDVCTGSKAQCEKPAASSFNVAVVYATVIPIVCVTIVICVILFLLWRKHKKDKLNDDDPDFNGEMEYLPELHENPFITNKYNNKSVTTGDLSSNTENDDSGDIQNEKDFYQSLQPPINKNNDTNNGNLRNITENSANNTQTDLISTHSNNTRQSSSSNLSHLPNSNGKVSNVNPFQLPMLHTDNLDNKNASNEDLISYVRAYDYGGYSFTGSNSKAPTNAAVQSVLNSSSNTINSSSAHSSKMYQTKPLNNTVNPMTPLFQNNPYSAQLNRNINVTNNEPSVFRSPLQKSFSYNNGKDTAETDEEMDKDKEPEVLPSQEEKQTVNTDESLNGNMEPVNTNEELEKMNEEELTTAIGKLEKREQNLNDKDIILNLPKKQNTKEEESIKRLKSIYKVYLDRRISSLAGGSVLLENHTESNNPQDNILKNNQATSHASYYGATKDISNIISEDDESELDEDNMPMPVLNEEPELNILSQENEGETYAKDKTIEKNSQSEIVNSKINNTSINANEFDKPNTNLGNNNDNKSRKISQRHTSSIYSELPPKFNYKDKSYESHELPQMNLSEYQGTSDPQSFNDQYQFDPTSQQYYYYDPASQYHYYFDPQTKNYYFYEPTTQQYYYHDPATQQQYFYDIENHQPYYYDTTLEQYLYLPPQQLQLQQQQQQQQQQQFDGQYNMDTIAEENSNSDYSTYQQPSNLPYHKMHPQTKEMIEELPTPSTLMHSESASSLTSFKPQSRNNTMLGGNPVNRAFNPMDNPEISYNKEFSSNKSNNNSQNPNYYPNKTSSLSPNNDTPAKPQVLPHHLRNSIVMTNPMELGSNKKTYRPAGSFRNATMFLNHQTQSRNAHMANGGQDFRVSHLIDDADLQVPVKLTQTLLPHDYGSKEDLRRQLK